MTPVRLLTSTIASLPRAALARHGIHLIPFTIQFLDGNYKESEDLDLAEFYRRLEQAEAIPTTSPTSTAQWLQIFQQLDGAPALVFHVASQLSRSYEFAVQAAGRLGGEGIVNIDSGSFSLGAGLLVLEAAAALERGESLAATAALIERLRPHAFMMFTAPSVRYLRMSGRVGRLPALAASLIGIQPALALGPEGIEVAGRSRSAPAARELMLEKLAAFAGARGLRALGVTHTNDPAAAESFAAQVAGRFPGVPLAVSDAGPILAVHAGPGVLGLAAIREP
ncbi:MAG TPA: DegV family protein [Herpetosiphonaceae bacterium]